MIGIGKKTAWNAWVCDYVIPTMVELTTITHNNICPACEKDLASTLYVHSFGANAYTNRSNYPVPMNMDGDGMNDSKRGYLWTTMADTSFASL